MHSRSRALEATVAAFVLIASGCPAVEPPPRGLNSPLVTHHRAISLRPGWTLDAPLSGGELDSYRFKLRSEVLVELTVEQQGIDVVVRLFDSRGTLLTEVDSPNDVLGPEPIPLLPSTSEVHRLEVHAADIRAGQGSYRLVVGSVRPATKRDRAWVAAERTFAEAEALRRRDDRHSIAAGVNKARHALASFRAIEEPLREADVQFALGRGFVALGRQATACLHFEKALALYRRLKEDRQVARTLSLIGQAHVALGEAERALGVYQRALALHQSLGQRREEIVTLHDLGKTYATLGKVERALGFYRRALIGWRELGETGNEGVTLSNIGQLMGELNDPEEALRHIKQALPLLEASGKRREKAVALARLGVIYALADRPRRGIAPLESALAIHRETGDRREEAVALNNLGWLRRKLGQLSLAQRSYREALSIFRSLLDRPSEAAALTNLGWIHTELGNHEAALAEFAGALPLFSTAANREGEAAALLGKAVSLRALGELAASQRCAEEALARIESLRKEPREPNLRVSFFASKQDYYVVYIDLLLERHRRNPASGHAARALEASEEMRTRSLLEMLTAAGGQADSAPLVAQEIATQVVDRDTVLLEYALGAKRSFLWVFSEDGLEFHELPSRAVIEGAARHALNLLSSGGGMAGRTQTELALAKLSELLLQPVARHLRDQRLVVVGDGILHYIPFSALPVPGASGQVPAEPLIARHEVVTLPSVSALAPLRWRAESRSSPAGQLAVLADPVFSPHDPRVRRASLTLTEVATLRAPEGDTFKRIPFSREEALGILALVPKASRLGALDFAANRETVTSGALGRYRIVHFATHGVFDSDRPERSGLILSLVDATGKRRLGFLSAADIYQLELHADLVVLSACQTALGKEVRGEGLIGLTRGFLYSGAQSIVVSLWPVEDRATAELMVRFYRALLERRLPPAAALRDAQLSLRQEPLYRDPYSWAGFMLQGEWRAVHH